MFRLKNWTECPPGSFFWPKETIDGVEFPEIESSPLIKQVAYELKERRKINNQPRATFAECLSDVDSFTCTRLNNDPRYCYNTDRSIESLHPAVVRGGCSGCGIRLK